MPVYRYSITFEAADDEAANNQAWGNDEEHYQAANSNFEHIHEESLVYAETGEVVP